MFILFSPLLGASKEIGTALTRVCLRHKAVETRMKTFTTAIMDSLIIPLQVCENVFKSYFAQLIISIKFQGKTGGLETSSRHLR
jgi:IRSp53/MIM homology domain